MLSTANQGNVAEEVLLSVLRFTEVSRIRSSDRAMIEFAAGHGLRVVMAEKGALGDTCAVLSGNTLFVNLFSGATNRERTQIIARLVCLGSRAAQYDAYMEDGIEQGIADDFAKKVAVGELITRQGQFTLRYNDRRRTPRDLPMARRIDIDAGLQGESDGFCEVGVDRWPDGD